MLGLNLLNAKPLSILKDPFRKSCVTNVRIVMNRRGLYDEGEPYWHASVDFRNGNTKGEQKFADRATFQEITSDVEAFLKTLE